MKKYIGIKQVEAKPMTRGDYLDCQTKCNTLIKIVNRRKKV